MPLYFVVCTSCNHPDRRILEPEQLRGVVCRKCGGKVRRTPHPPSAHLKERIDNGLQPKTLENFVDGAAIVHERAHLDLSKPDFQKQDKE